MEANFLGIFFFEQCVCLIAWNQLFFITFIYKSFHALSVFFCDSSYPAALAMVASGKVNIRQLITHNYVLEDTLSAFETAKTGAGGAIKVMIHCKEGITLENAILNQG